MAIALRAATVGTYGTGGSGTENKPAGVVSGDVLVATLYHTGTPTITGPSGWTREIRVTGVSDIGWVADFWYKVAGGSEPSTYTWTGGTDHMIIIAAYSGVDTTTPLDIAVTSATATSGTSLNISGTTVTADAWVIVGGWHYDAPALGVPSGMTARGNSEGVLLCDVAQAVAGGTGTKTVTGTNGIEKIAIITALRPASGAAATSNVPARGVRLPYAILAR